MSFDTYENSKRENHAIFLYHFTNGTDEWFYSKGTESTVVFGGDSYTPEVISHSDISQTQNPYDDKIEVTCRTGIDLISDNVGKFQAPRIWLNLYKIQNNDPTLYKRIWYGYIDVITKNDKTTSIVIASIAAALNKRVCKKVHSYLCQHVLYDAGCGLDADSHKHAGTITGITDGTLIGAAVFNDTLDKYLTSKIITSDGEERQIIADPGTGIVEILRPFSSAIITTTFFVYDKCDRLLTGSCTAFSNTDNFFGDTDMKNNPYENVNQDSGAILTNPISEN